MAIDISGYQNWEKVVAPGGQVYFKVPGSGYLYDPFLSQAKGKNVFWTDPRKDYNSKVAADKAAADAASPGNQILQAAAPIGAKMAGDTLVKGVGNLMSNKGFFGAPADATTTPGIGAGAAAPTATSAGQAFSNSALAGGASIDAGGVVPVGTAVNGGTLMSDGSTAAANAAGDSSSGFTGMLGSAAPYLGVAGAGLGAYGVANAIKSGNEKQGALSGAGTGLGLAAAAPLLGLGPLGWAGFGLMALGGAGLGSALTAGLYHENTRQVQQKHTQDLLDQHPDDPNYQSYVNAMRDQNNAAPADPKNPFHGGQYSSWDQYKTAGLDANDLTGVYGNLKTFGNQWTNLSTDQQKSVTQGLINAGLYDSKKGEVVITDADKAKQIKDQILNGNVAPAQNGAQAGAAQAVTNPLVQQAQQPAMMPARSATSSPGMGLNGQPLSSSQMAQTYGKQLADRMNQKGK